MKDKLRRVGLAVVAMLLVAFGVDACDPGPKCLDYETVTTYTITGKGQLVPSFTVYCARYETPSPSPAGPNH